MDFRDQRKRRRIQIAQEAIAERGFGFYAVAHGVNVHLFLVYRLKNSQVIELVGRNIVAGEHFGAAEKISLKKGIAPAESALEVVIRFDFFGDEPQMFFGEGPGEALLFEFRGKQHIDFYECGKLRERQPRRGFLKIIEGDQITHVLQAAASGDDFIVGLNRLEDFENDAIRGECHRKITQEKVTSAVDEGATAVREAVNAKKKQAINRGSGGGFGTRAVKEILGPGAKEQFVTVDVAFGIENRLTREEFFQRHFLLPDGEAAHILGRGKGRDCQSWLLRRVVTPGTYAGLDMEDRNSAFVLFFDRRPSSNSMASTVERGLRTFRSTQMRLSSSGGSSSSSLRVPERLISIVGKTRLSTSRRSRLISMLPVPLNSSKMTSSMRLPVSIRAVAMIVSEPPSSILRAAPKKRFGRCNALASTPPVRTLPEDGTTVLYARPRRVIESSRITTSFLCSTRRLAFSMTISATATWRVAGSSKVELTTSPFTVRCMSVTSSGRSSTSSTMR